MRCRRIKKENQNDYLVWFGSYGKDSEGKAKFFNPDDIHDNFSEDQYAVVDKLTQQLSILEGELWYDVNFGLPLLDKIKNKNEIDTVVLDILLSNDDIQEITSFSSEVINHNYTASIDITTIYGVINLTI